MIERSSRAFGIFRWYRLEVESYIRGYFSGRMSLLFEKNFEPEF
jgi:hypothetical protein